MITTPNDISNCVLWLDATDISTLYQDISVASTQRRNLYAVSNSIRSVGRSDLWTTDTNWFYTTFTTVSAPDKSNSRTWSVLDGNYNAYSTDRWITLYQYVPETDVYTLSFFVKNNGHRYIYFNFDGTNAYVDLNTGIVSGVTGGVVVNTRPATVDYPATLDAATGWYRVYITKTLTGSVGPLSLTIRASTTNTTAGWQRVNSPGKGYAIWGIMLERSNVLGAYIPSPTLECSFEDGTSVATKTTPLTPVTSNNNNVGYWLNKSLSADVFGLSGVQVFEENSDFRPKYTISGIISGVYFDYSYLSTRLLDAPINVPTQTVFAVMSINWDNGVEEANRSFITQSLSTEDIRSYTGSTGNNNYTPLVNPATEALPCSIVGVSAVSFFPVNMSWMVRNPVQYNRLSNNANKDNINIRSLYRMTRHADHTYSTAWNRIEPEYKVGQGPEIWNSNNRASLYNTPTLTAVSAANIFRLGTGIEGTTLDHNWSLRWPLTRRNETYFGTRATYYEVVLYNRELNKDEIDDIEDYLTRKWLAIPDKGIGSRQVWALSDGELSSTNIFSISSEPAPFNVLLSSDVIYTNGYMLTATTDQSINIITNSPTPKTNRAGGCVIMTEGVTLSAKVVGGSSSGAVVVPSGVNCTIHGNVFGGAERYDTHFTRPASALFVPGVYIHPTGFLNLSGSAYGGFELHSPGIATDGGGFNYTGILEGGGYTTYSIYWGTKGGTYSYGASAINTNLSFKNRKVQNGNVSAGLYTHNCSVILNDCVVEAVYNGANIYFANRGVDRYGLYPSYGLTCYHSSNTLLTAINTMFIGVTSSGLTNQASTGGYVHGGTALWAFNSEVYLENCYIEGSKKPAAVNNDANGGLRTLYDGRNQAIRLSSSTSLKGINCSINGADNSYINYESSVGKTGLYVDAGTTTILINTTVNTKPNTKLNRGIYINNNAVVMLSGTVRGGYRAVGTSFPGIYNRGVLYVDGVIAPNYSGSPAIDNESNGQAVLSGRIKQGGPLCNTITSRGMLTAFYSEPLISSARGYTPIQAETCIFKSLCANSLYSQFSVDGVQQIFQYLDDNYNLNQPLSTDVLKDYVYGPIGFELTGTSIIPEVSATIIGVPVRSVYGTRKPLTVDALWNQPTTAVTSLSDTIPIPLSAIVFSKFINPMTSVSLSAITQSLTDIPPPGL